MKEHCLWCSAGFHYLYNKCVNSSSSFSDSIYVLQSEQVDAVRRLNSYGNKLWNFQDVIEKFVVICLKVQLWFCFESDWRINLSILGYKISKFTMKYGLIFFCLVSSHTKKNIWNHYGDTVTLYTCPVGFSESCLSLWYRSHLFLPGFDLVLATTTLNPSLGSHLLTSITPSKMGIGALKDVWMWYSSYKTRKVSG